MSQLDVRDAKKALTTRLRDWGVQGDAGALADGFIDDLVARGWQMAPFRETRPFPPFAAEACNTCGGEYGPTCCDKPSQRPEPGDHIRQAAEARELLRAALGVTA